MKMGRWSWGVRDGFGLYGVVDESAEGLLCHECGERHFHLGVHVARGHGITARRYRELHGLHLRRGLVSAEIRQKVTDNAAAAYAGKSAFKDARDPAAASRAAVASPGMSAAGLASSRAIAGTRRKVIVVECQWCGFLFCPLADANRRKHCSYSCSSKHTRATRAGRA